MLRLDDEGVQVDWLPYFYVEITRTGLRVPIRRRSFTIGGRGCDLRLPDSDDQAGELTMHGDGRLELITDDDMVDIRPGERFECGGHQLVVGRHEPKSVATTVDMRDWVWPVSVVLDGGGAVRLVHEDGTEHKVRTGNRSKLVTLLAAQHLADHAEGKARRDRGWAFDADLITAIWGPVDVERHRNNLNVLIARTRQEIRDAGLDPSIVERRQRHVRVRVEAVDGDLPG